MIVGLDAKATKEKPQNDKVTRYRVPGATLRMLLRGNLSGLVKPLQW